MSLSLLSIPTPSPLLFPKLKFPFFSIRSISTPHHPITITNHTAATATTTSSSAGDTSKWDSADYELILKGGEQVTSVLQEIIQLLEDMDMDEASEAAAVEIASQGVIGKRVDEMETGFIMALDYMIQIADKDLDHQVNW